MKYPLLTPLAGMCSVQALPPAPFYTHYRTVRSEVGQFVEVTAVLSWMSRNRALLH